MSSAISGPRILAVDDDTSICNVLEKVLTRAGFGVESVHTGADCLSAARSDPPSLIVLDIILPDIDGYEVCRNIRAEPGLEAIPVLFLTTLGGDQDKTRAFRSGANGWIQKPFEAGELLTAVQEQLARHQVFQKVAENRILVPDRPSHWTQWGLPPTYAAFKAHLLRAMPTIFAPETLEHVTPRDLYGAVSRLGVASEAIAKEIAEFIGVDYLPTIEPDFLQLGVLPGPFCRNYGVVPFGFDEDTVRIACSMPFDWELIDALEQTLWHDGHANLVISPPEALAVLISDVEGHGSGRVPTDSAPKQEGLNVVRDTTPEVSSEHPILVLANEILRAAVETRASDVHIEPKAEYTQVRMRIDGDMHDTQRLEVRAAPMLISRFKALSGMDIAEKRRPQDGALEVMIGDRRFKLRLATTLASDGESLVIRLLEPSAAAVPLEELGMTPFQVATMHELANRHQGMILMVGPTGSGKSTTIFSVLSNVNGHVRSIMTVEDPIEYRIPGANQQQVNVKAGATFESLLKSAVRQDPDILFLGEVRDSFSAKASMDFASSGHLTISTLHSSNATTAVFRLERLGISRGAMADSLLAVVAQKLLKKLCVHCKEIGPITAEERGKLAQFTDQVPEVVARPVGCPKCRSSGYWGREGCYEIMRFDPALGERVRRGDSVAEIRMFARARGDLLVSHHAMEKVRDHIFAVDDVYETVLLEEVRFRSDVHATPDPGLPVEAPAASLPEAALAPSPIEAEVWPTPGDGSPEVDSWAAQPVMVVPSPQVDASTPPVDSQGQLIDIIWDEDVGGGPPSVGANPASTPEPPPQATGAPTLAGAPRILVVEDDPDAQTLIELFLTHDGYAVDKAGDGVEALMMLGQSPYDLILSDLNMPNLDGIKLLELIVQKGVQTPVAFLTGERSGEMEGRLLELGAAEYIRKPIKREVLLARVKRVVGKGNNG